MAVSAKSPRRASRVEVVFVRAAAIVASLRQPYSSLLDRRRYGAASALVQMRVLTAPSLLGTVLAKHGRLEARWLRRGPAPEIKSSGGQRNRGRKGKPHPLRRTRLAFQEEPFPIAVRVLRIAFDEHVAVFRAVTVPARVIDDFHGIHEPTIPRGPGEPSGPEALDA